MRAIVLFSGGKDSTLALHWAVFHGFEPEVVIVQAPEDSWMFHAPVYPKYEEILPFPVHYVTVSGEKEKEVLELAKALRKIRADAIITGALESEYQRTRIEWIARKLRLRPYSPFWLNDPEKHLLRCAKAFKFIIIRVAAEGLDESWIGKVIGIKEALEIIELSKKYGFHPSFEGGEAETLVLEAPLFKKPVPNPFEGRECTSS